jgi:mannose-6-phosphate isomerase-like protein (cupin superfamily)
VQRSDPFVLDATQARLDSPSGNAFRNAFKLLAEDTGGQFSFLEWELDPWQPGPGMHAHNFDECFYVLNGEVEFQVGDERHVLGARNLAWVPRKTPHSFANAGAEPASGISVAAPGGLENILTAHAAGEPLPSEFEVDLIGPPIVSERAPKNRAEG